MARERIERCRRKHELHAGQRASDIVRVCRHRCGQNRPGNLQISWPADHTGWQLQSQTNNLTSGLGTNWINVPGSDQTNQMTVPLNSTNGAVFFRLVRPY